MARAQALLWAALAQVVTSQNETESTPEPEGFFTHGAIVGCIVGLLVAFFLVAGIAVPLMMKHLKAQNATMVSKEGVDFWFTARNSQSWPVIALSLTATSAGAWLLYTPAEAAFVGGWWALIGYCIAITLGPLFIIIAGPMFRSQCGDAANITDWVHQRFGPVVHLWFSLVLIYYMFIYMTGQLKTMGDMVRMYTCANPSNPFSDEGCLAPEAGLIPVALVTLTYTMFGGLPSSIMTDQVQALSILIIVIILSIFVFAEADTSEETWEKVSSWNDRGFEMGFGLCFAVFGAEVFNLAFWQRVYIAKDDRQLRIGFAVGAIAVAVLTFLFGLVGMVLKAQMLKAGPISPFHVAAFTFFEINGMPATGSGIRMLVFILATCMITSSVDSFQIGITSVITKFLQKYEVDTMKSLVIGLVAMLVVNVPSIIFASYSVHDVNENFNGLAVRLTDLFSMADIITITLVVPIFSGLYPFATRKGCIAGISTGMLTIMVWGWFEFGYFMAGLEMMTMMCFGSTRAVSPPALDDGSPFCGFYSRRSPMLFPTIVATTAIATYTVSWMEQVLIRLDTIIGGGASLGGANKESTA